MKRDLKEDWLALRKIESSSKVEDEVEWVRLHEVAAKEWLRRAIKAEARLRDIAEMLGL